MNFFKSEDGNIDINNKTQVRQKQIAIILILLTFPFEAK